MSLSDEMRQKSPSENWRVSKKNNKKILWFFFSSSSPLFPSVSEPPLPPLCYCPPPQKKDRIASLCHSVALCTLPGCSYHSALPLSLPLSPPFSSKCFNGDRKPDGDTFSAFAFPSLSLPLFLWRSVTFCTVFSLSPPSSSSFSSLPQTIHVGGLENKTVGWEDPR